MFSIDYRSREPIYEQLYNNVIRLLLLGVLKADQQLPPVRQLATELGINPNTVFKAYKNLENDGVIYSVVGKGSFISSDTDIVGYRKAELLRKITENVQNAVKLGIERQQITEIVNTVYHKGVNDL